VRWDRARFYMRCGRCGAEIAPGDAVCLMELRTVTKPRCAACEGPAPPDLPADIERIDPVPTLTKCSGILPFGLTRGTR
jgi:hypothetical protein